MKNFSGVQGAVFKKSPLVGEVINQANRALLKENR
jgi:hypothetical protein